MSIGLPHRIQSGIAFFKAARWLAQFAVTSRLEQNLMVPLNISCSCWRGSGGVGGHCIGETGATVVAAEIVEGFRCGDVGVTTATATLAPPVHSTLLPAPAPALPRMPAADIEVVEVVGVDKADKADKAADGWGLHLRL